MVELQRSALLPALFEQLEDASRVTVLHIGPAQADTVAFFSQYRCSLHFIDLFGDLAELRSQPAQEVPPSKDQTAGSVVADQIESNSQARRRLREILSFPQGTRIDLCLFWDLFNFLDPAAISALFDVLRPRLHSRSMGHGFAVHSLSTPQSGMLYGVSGADEISLRPRPGTLPCYQPHNQGQLGKMLDGFRISRSVLLSEGRLELLLTSRR